MAGKRGAQGKPGKDGVGANAIADNCLIVAEDLGNDSTAQPHSWSFPYKTYEAAQADAVAGDTIVFMPGTHEIITGLLAMVGVSIYAFPTAIINVRNNQTVVGTEGLNITGEGIWTFYDRGITILAGNHDNNATYTFNFREIHIKVEWALKTAFGNVNMQGGNVYIEFMGTTFFWLADWIGAKANISIENLFDYSDYESTKSGENIRVHSITNGAEFCFTFKKIFTYNSRCLVLTNESDSYNATVRGDVLQNIQLSGTAPNCTVYMTGNGANYNLYGNYQTNCDQCIIVTSSPTNLLPIKVYHEGNIYSVNISGCVTVAGLLAYFKQRGIYIGGVTGSVFPESTIIKVGIYNDYNYLLPIDGVTSGGNVEINGTIVNKQDFDSSEVYAVYDLGDTADVSKLRINNSKFVFTGTTPSLAVRAENNQSLEIVGVLATNATTGQSNYTQVGTGIIDIAAYTDDEIL